MNKTVHLARIIARHQSEYDPGEPLDVVVTDLIADLVGYAHSLGHDGDTILDTARSHFEAERLDRCGDCGSTLSACFCDDVDPAAETHDYGLCAVCGEPMIFAVESDDRPHTMPDDDTQECHPACCPVCAICLPTTTTEQEPRP